MTGWIKTCDRFIPGTDLVLSESGDQCLINTNFRIAAALLGTGSLGQCSLDFA